MGYAHRGIRVPIIADDEQFQRRLKENAGAAKVFSREWSDAQIKVALAKDKLSAAEKRYGVESAQAARATLSLRGAQRELIGETGRLGSVMSGHSAQLRHLKHDLSETERGVLSASGAFRSMGRSIAFASAGYLGTAGFIDVVKTSVKAADDLDHQLGRTDTTFGRSADTVKKWSKSSADAMGLSQAAALDHASAIGALLKNMDYVPAKAAAMSKALVQRAADVGAQRRTDPSGVLSAFEAGITGRTRGLKSYGIVIDAAAIKEEAYRLGIAKSTVDEQKVTDARQRVAIATAKAQDALAKYGTGTTQAAQAALTQQKAEEGLKKALDGSSGALTAAQRAAATYQLILAQTTDAQGKFKGSSNDLEVQQLKLRAQITNLEADIGNQLRPEILAVVRDLDAWVKHLNDTGEAHRLVKKAVHDLNVAVHAGTDIVHAAETAFKALSDAVGGDKHAVELLVGAYLSFKAANVLSSITVAAKTLGLIGAEASTATGEVTALRASIVGLSGLNPVVTITLAVAGAAALDKYLGWASKGLPGTSTPGSAPASTNDPATWTKWEKAAYAVQHQTGTHTADWFISHPAAEMKAIRAGLRSDHPAKTTGPGGAHSGGTYGKSDVYSLLIAQGATPNEAAYLTYASTTHEDPAGNPSALNDNAKTHDYSVGLFQINFRDMHNQWMRGGPAAAAKLAQDPAAQARYALSLLRGPSGAGNWPTSAGMASSFGLGGGSGGGGGGGGSGLHVGHVTHVKKPAVISGAALLSTSLRTKLAHEVSKASTTSGAAALAWLDREKDDLEQAKKDLTAQLGQAKKGSKQYDAIKLEISNLNTQLDGIPKKVAANLKAQAVAIKAAFSSRISSAQSNFTALFNQLQSDLLTQLQTNVQKHIDTVIGPKYFQNGVLSPLEARLAGMQAGDTSKGLQDALKAAQKQLGLDTNGSPLETRLDVATGAKTQIFSGAGPADQIAADQEAVDQAQRAIDENNLAIDAVAERTKADKDYAAAVVQYQDEQTIVARQLNDRLVELQNGVLNGTKKLSDLTGIAGDFGLTIDGSSTILGTDFSQLGGAAQALAGILLDEAAKLAAIGDLKDAAAIQKLIDDLAIGGNNNSGYGAGGNLNGTLDPAIAAALRARGQSIPKLAKGGIVTQPTLALIGEAGREAIVPLDSHGIGGGSQTIDNHITIQFDGRTIWSGLKRHAIRDGRLNVKTGIK